jgi:APA family basic amino acid/polyamine antiporter
VSAGPPPPPRLTGWQAGALVVGSMVGTGVFTTSGLLLGSLGRGAVLLVWVVGGLAALCGALVYAELGAMLPRVGGEYVYLSRAFPPVVGFVSGWLALLAGFSAPVAAGAAAFGRYVAAALPAVPAPLAALALIVAVTALHARDVTGAGRFQFVVTAINVVAMLGLCLLGGVALLGRAPAATEAALPGPSAAALAVGLVLVSYSYLGWNAAAYVAGELATPQRSLPRALVVGCLLVTGLYVALNGIFLAALPAAALAGRIEVAHLVATSLFGAGAARGLSLLIALVLAGSVSALTMTGPRIYLAMAEDGAFPRLFAQRNARGAPAAGVLLQGGLALVMVATASFDALLVYVGFTLSLSAAATVAAAAWLRHKEPDLPRPFRTPGWPVTPALFFALALWTTAYSVQERPRESAAGALSVLAGAVIYLLWRRRRVT